MPNPISEDLLYDSTQPEIVLPSDPMTPKQFAEKLSAYGIECPEDTIFTSIRCSREDFMGDEYTITFLMPDSMMPVINLYVTLTKSRDGWSLHMVTDGRYLSAKSKWEYKARTIQYLTQRDSSDRLIIHRVPYMTLDTTILPKEDVYTRGDEVATTIVLHPANLINIILAAKPDEFGSFTLDIPSEND